MATIHDLNRQILEMLHLRHAAPEWASWAELRWSTGSSPNASRAFDFAALGLWSRSRAQLIIYEVKAARSDWLRELDQPRKRELAERVANETWFASPCGIIQPSEVPEGWGLLELLSTGKLRRKVVAKQRLRPPLPEAFVLSVARRSADEPSPLPAVAWHYAGEEIPEEKLVEVAEKVLHRYLDTARREGLREGRAELEQSPRYLDMSEVYRIALKVCGRTSWNETLASKFETWVENTKKGSLSPQIMRHIANLSDQATELARTLAEIANPAKRTDSTESPRTAVEGSSETASSAGDL